MKKSRKITTIYSSKTNSIGLLQTNKELKANLKRIVEDKDDAVDLQGSN
jgi:hypothetical protein